MSLKSSPANPRVTESLAMDHYRLHIIERWPEGAHKDAALSSVRCSLAGLFRRSEFSGPDSWRCIACGVGMARNSNPPNLVLAA